MVVPSAVVQAAEAAPVAQVVHSVLAVAALVDPVLVAPVDLADPEPDPEVLAGVEAADRLCQAGAVLVVVPEQRAALTKAVRLFAELASRLKISSCQR